MQVIMSMEEYEQLKENEYNFKILKQYVQNQEEEKQKNKFGLKADPLLLNALKENNFILLEEELECLKNKQAY